MTREEWTAVQEAEEAAWFRELEWRRTARRLEALYAAQTAGDGSAYTRQRVERLEAVQAALQGFPAALAN
ncbi:hypothetical protein J7E93_09395 [Streptomyces sp. ISL-36]|uniref:hypothetical protein n=1 Tax=Streptomyces sp. ISL-36 TaxID=2819182 RepID=UPI001BECE421|nr:hypothetical protein [Streptomyces sp. ISL-36]MBT2440319.1 hypothetical protein [Streptomyces sp. ISL-36]